MDKKSTVKNLIADNRIPDAIKMLREELGDNAVFLLESQWNQLRSDEISGILSYSETTQRRNQIVNALLSLADKIGYAGASAPLQGKAQFKLFLSYSHKDEDMKEQLDTHFAGLRRSGKIATWNDRQILPGADWDDNIKDELHNADIILFLISANFIASDYIWKQEVPLALERHKRKEAVVIPILLRPCDVEGLEFMRLQGLPKNFKPVSSFPDRDEVLSHIAKEIRRLVDALSA
jgi:hypothetical protein